MFENRLFSMDIVSDINRDIKEYYDGNIAELDEELMNYFYNMLQDVNDEDEALMALDAIETLVETRNELRHYGGKINE